MKNKLKSLVLFVTFFANSQAYASPPGPPPLGTPIITLTATPVAGYSNVFEIKGTCNPGLGKPILQFKPISLTPPSPPTGGVAKYAVEKWAINVNGIPWYTNTANDAMTVPPGANNGCQNGGIKGIYFMHPLDWASGTWKLKLHQYDSNNNTVNTSAPVTVTLP